MVTLTINLNGVNDHINKFRRPCGSVSRSRQCVACPGSGRSKLLANDADQYADFKQEMRRFLPATLVTETVEQPAFWQYVTTTIANECQRASGYLLSGGELERFKM